MMRYLFAAFVLLVSGSVSAAVTWPSGYTQDACHVQPSTKAAGCAAGNKLFRIQWDNCTNGAGNGGPGYFNWQCSSSTGHELSDVCSVSSPDFNANWCAQNGGTPDYGCPPGVPYVDGQCATDENGPTECGAGYSKFTVGGKTSCVENMPSQCGSGDRVWVNGVDACGSERDACNSSGGTFGIINGQSVCVPQEYADDLPTCASGSAEYVDNGNGSSAFACATVTSPSSESDPTNPTEQDPTGLGGKLDRITQTLERQTASIVNALGGAGTPVAGGTGSGSGSGPGDGEGEDGEAGPCDPNEENYLSCIGMPDVIQMIADNEADSILGNAAAVGDGHLDAAAGTLTDFVQSPIEVAEPTEIQTLVTGLFPTPVACTDLVMQVHGHAMTISCAKLQPLRDWIGFALAIGTVWYCFQIAFGRGV